MSPTYFQKVDRITILVGILMSAVMYFWKGGGPAVSAALGCAVGMLNFLAQRYATAALIRRTVAGDTGGLPPAVLFLLKYVGLAIALVLILGVKRVDLIGFTAGFFSYIVAVIAVGTTTVVPPAEVSSDAVPVADIEAD